MTQTTKLLLGALLAVVVTWMGKGIFVEKFILPITERESKLKSLKSNIKSAEERELEVLVAGKRLDDWRQRCLPPDAKRAQSLYIQWVTHIVMLSGFDRDTKVIPGPVKLQPGGAYTSFTVDIKGGGGGNSDAEANIQAITRFLYHFHRTDLLQRVVSLNIDSSGAEGNPDHGVKMKLEGISITGTKPRDRLFSRTRLNKDTQDDDDQISVASNAGFPKAPGFQIRIGKEYLTVTEIKQTTWTVERAVDATKASDYLSGEIVELAPRRQIQARLTKAIKADATTIQVADHVAFPVIGGFLVQIGQETLAVTEIDGQKWTVRRGMENSQATAHKRNSTIALEMSLPDYLMAVTRDNPFMKPPKPKQYKPELNIRDVLVIRGTPIKAQAKLANRNPELGSPLFGIDDDAPKGLTINEKTGELSWEPADDVASEEYAVTVSARQTENPDKLFTQKINITLRDPNTAPVLEIVETHQVYLGQTVAFVAKATDSDKHSLSFSLAKGSPRGASIDADSGQFTWVPSLETNPGEHKATVVVTDNGSPSSSSKQTVTIEVVEDASQFTFLIASIVQDEQREAWLYNRADNQRMVLFEGDRFVVGSIKARVVSIDNDALVYRRNDDTFRLELGQSMQDVKPLAAAVPKTTAGGQPAATTNDRPAARD